jgi:uncharacterized protein YcbX
MSSQVKDFVEDAWIGQTLRIGNEVRLAVTGPCPRCVMITLAEMRRVLRPGGLLIASVNHPFVEHLSQNSRPNYFATTSYTDAWTFADSPSR